MIEKKDLHLNFIKKEAQTGSFRGMRYLLQRKKEEGEDRLETVLWPEPLCFVKTPESEKQRQCFPLTDEGLEEVVAWLNREYETQRDRWTAAAGAFYTPDRQ